MKPRSKVREFFETIIVAFILAMLIRAFLLEVFWIPSGSMIPSLGIQDRIVVNKLAYGIPNPFFKFQEYHRVMIIPQVGVIPEVSFPNFFYDAALPVFGWQYLVDFRRDPSRFHVIVFRLGKRELIKRVIGLPGEKIEVRAGLVYINDKYLSEQHAMNRDQDNFGPVIIPPNSYFMMGDNRPESADSRYFGFLSRKEIVGPAFWRIWPVWEFGPII